MPNYTQLKDVTNWGDAQTSELLRFSIMSFLEWGFLSIGAWANVTIPASGAYGGSPWQLRQVSDPYYTDGQVWEGFRQNWVWESNLPYDYQPIAISGVNVNGQFLPTDTTGPSGYVINYLEGRIVFNSAVTGTVTAEYSYKYVRIATADEPWFQELQFGSLRDDDPQVQLVASGDWNVLAQSRIQLPAVVVETVPRVRQTPYEIGTTSRWQDQDVLFHIYAETPYDRDKLHDILVAQQENTFQGLDKDTMLASGAYPLDANESPVSGALMYSNLADTYPWRKVTFWQCRSDEQFSVAPLHVATVRSTFRVCLP